MRKEISKIDFLGVFIIHYKTQINNNDELMLGETHLKENNLEQKLKHILFYHQSMRIYFILVEIL